MNTQKLLKTVAATASAATLALALGACAHHTATAGDDYGQVRPEAAAQKQTTPDQVVGTAPAPSNAQNVTAPSSPAIIPGPAKVDNSGNAYTSSSVGSAGNGSATGLNTNINIIPKNGTSSVTVSQSPAVVAETTPAPVVIETPAPTPAPVITETTTTTETVPMTSSTTTQTQTTETTTPTETKHRRMRKD